MDQPSISNFLLVFCTCPDQDEARRIARSVIERRLAACVNILPAVESIFRWEGTIDSASESLLLIKTTAERFAELRDHIAELHSYDVPEVIALPLTAGFDPYLGWIKESVA